MRKKNYALRYVAGQPAKRIFPPDLLLPVPHLLPEGIKLPAYPTLKLLVWNIFKQQRADWLTVLKKYGDHCHLILLQEAQTTPELIDFATENYSSVDQVPALNLPQHASGVMSLARTTPIFCCPLREKEPLLRLAKSALITVYPMPDGQLLMVANVHAINFSLGIEAYRKQLASLGELLKTHQGPVLLGGDFNAWSRQRSHILYRFIRKQSLKEVNFSDDYRKTAFGRPLDFVFYRDLKIKHSQVIETNASDHNPLYVEFEY